MHNDPICGKPNKLKIRKSSLSHPKFVQPNPNTNVVIAAFTTAYARLQLYDELDMLGERVLYCDTDSVIYRSQPGQPEPRLGNNIGDLTDELGGEHITVFASGSPKNYGYKTSGGKTEVNVRGITLDVRVGVSSS